MRRLLYLGLPLVALALQAAEVPAGTVIRVRTEQTMDTARNRPGDRFAAEVAEPVRVNGNLIIPKGARCWGRITAARPSGRLKGEGALGLTLESVTLHGKSYRIETSGLSRHTGPHRNRNLAWTGGGAGGGALVAGLAAGGPWTLAGVGIGAGAGLATAAVTGRKQVSIPAESVISFTLKQGVQLAP